MSGRNKTDMRQARALHKQQQTQNVALMSIAAIAAWLSVPAVCAVRSNTLFEIPSASFVCGGALALVVAVCVGVITSIRPTIKIFCRECGKHIPTTGPWRCGYCDHVNKYNTYLDECTKCRQSARSYACPQCGVLNYLDEQQDGRHPASEADSSGPSLHRDVWEDRRETIRERKYEIQLATLDAELAEAKARLPKAQKRRSVREVVKQQFSHAHERHLAIMEEQREAIKRIKKQYADDPDLRDHLIERIQIWAEEQQD
jgi:predicted RNA-binding Zn-ribbon protein involved in translation (DUF1610 family)